jgi:hypothetical protein
MSVKLPDNCQIREHSWPCRFHINNIKHIIGIQKRQKIILVFKMPQKKLRKDKMLVFEIQKIISGLQI